MEQTDDNEDLGNTGLVSTGQGQAERVQEVTLEADEVRDPPSESLSATVTAQLAHIPSTTMPSSTSETSHQEKTADCIDFKLVYNKKKIDVNYRLDATVADLKVHVEKVTGVPVSMQKLMFKGLAKDHQTLRELKVIGGSKLMVVGSTLDDVLAVSGVRREDIQKEEAASSNITQQSLSQQTVHKKVLDKYGKPDDVPIGIKNRKDPLPSSPLSGMYNKTGSKVRLTFKLELDQLWIGTKERTDKVPMNSIKAVVSEPMHGHDNYHMMGLQLGPTEASRYWLYWVPAQYVDAIKDSILGKWQFF